MSKIIIIITTKKKKEKLKKTIKGRKNKIKVKIISTRDEESDTMI